MTFLALLTKELRLRLRSERTIWVIIIYILLLGLLGWYYISRFSNYNNYGTSIGEVGRTLYSLLAYVQLFLVLFITPAFTSTSINGEKERQTFDLLLCSRLSSFSLVAGKLVAGLTNGFLLIAASAPLFSLVFLFGGISPQQVFRALLVYVMTTILIGTFGILTSTLFKRPAVSTAVTYMAGVLWLTLPLVILFILLATGEGQNANTLQWLTLWHPVYALASTFTDPGINVSYKMGTLYIISWVGYTIIDIFAIAVFFLLSMLAVRPRTRRRSRRTHQHTRNATATV